ncbi:MAG: deoxyguanosinetriphosphate triphosphohydrolase [Bacteroidota bacterium]
MNWEKLLSSERVGQKRKGHEGQARSAFEQDYDRIIFSHPFRRLQDKTQVHPLPIYDFVHTRLTHSLEVSSVARSLGRSVGETVIARHPELASKYSHFDFGAITAAAALAHDLGNPPFGHSGEEAISDFFLHHERGKSFEALVGEKEWQDLTDFEGNAQGFRILNKRDYQGLKLTNATLAAFSKYPRESCISEVSRTRKSHKKYGFFQSEREIFKEIAEDLELIPLSESGDYVWCRHPLTFLVEAADDICYHIIDLEDGCRLGLVSEEETISLLAEIIEDRFDADKLSKINSKNEKIGLLRALSINTLIVQSAGVFLDNEEAILAGKFDAALVDDVECNQALKRIKDISIQKIYRSRSVIETEAAGFEVLPGLLDEFTDSAYHAYVDRSGYSKRHKSLKRLLPEEFDSQFDNDPPGAYDLLMHCVDFVAGMTDSYAISLYRKIKGITLPQGY